MSENKKRAKKKRAAERIKTNYAQPTADDDENLYKTLDVVDLERHGRDQYLFHVGVCYALGIYKLPEHGLVDLGAKLGVVDLANILSFFDKLKQNYLILNYKDKRGIENK